MEGVILKEERGKTVIILSIQDKAQNEEQISEFRIYPVQSEHLEGT